MLPSSPRKFEKLLYPNAITAITIKAKEIAFIIPLSNNITANIPNVALIPYKI